MSMPLNAIENVLTSNDCSRVDNTLVYKNFFDALFKIPDKRMQSRVLRVVGYSLASSTNQSTQTEQDAVLVTNLPKNTNVSCENNLGIRNIEEKPCSSHSLLAKRQRRRCQMKYPQACKESHTKALNTNISKNKSKSKNDEDHLISLEKLQTSHSLLSNQPTFLENKTINATSDKNVASISNMVDLLDLFEIDADRMAEKILFKEMIKELLICNIVFKNGLM